MVCLRFEGVGLRVFLEGDVGGGFLVACPASVARLVCHEMSHDPAPEVTGSLKKGGSREDKIIVNENHFTYPGPFFRAVFLPGIAIGSEFLPSDERKMKSRHLISAFLLLGGSTATAVSQSLLSETHVLRADDRQADFPTLAVDAEGTPHVAYVEWDTQQDTLHVAKLSGGFLTDELTIGEPGIIHQPALATDGSGTLHVVWSQVNEDNVMDLHTAQVLDGKAEVMTLARSPKGGNVFAKAATDAAGKVWVVWQGMRGGLSDIFCRVFDPATREWSAEIQVTADAGGQWEPCVVFAEGAAWILFDSSLGNEFNICATPIDAALKVGETKSLIATDRYEGRVSAIGASDGKGIWVACERGNQQWGLDTRAESHPMGLNGRKDTVFVYWDLASDVVEELPTPDGLFADLPPPPPYVPELRSDDPKAVEKAKARAEARLKGLTENARKKGLLAPNDLGALNLPHLMLDAAGRPWLIVRYFKSYCWTLALTRYDAATQSWTEPVVVPESTYSQDRQTSHALAPDGSLWITWPSDLRTSKLQKNSGIHLAKVATDVEVPLIVAPPANVREPFAAYVNEVTPERDREERHTLTHEGITYHLYWADYHRHTDVSNCVTANDGCVQEQYRYALDMGKLDSLGISDHTDIAKIYTPYEWWLNQKMVDVFHAPGFFLGMYAYEREQAWPHGHRNVIFAQRGGPVVYIQRQNYLESPWQATFPIATEGGIELTPQELWDVLVRYGKPVSVISHTGAAVGGTDWDLINTIDHRVENIIEIYQGARVSYEGKGAPQPTVGMRKGGKYIAPLGRPIATYKGYDNGVYQHALKVGHKLGVWADSDHISTHTSYGGVYVKEFTREGIIEGLNARRTIAATDKIFIDFSCNDNLLGTEVIVTGKPVLKFAIDGTASIKRVTLIRNEQDYQQWEPNAKTFEQLFTDESPAEGENRYYLRVEQSDGNMAWSSPVWVQVK